MDYFKALEPFERWFWRCNCLSQLRRGLKLRAVAMQARPPPAPHAVPREQTGVDGHFTSTRATVEATSWAFEGSGQEFRKGRLTAVISKGLDFPDTCREVVPGSVGHPFNCAAACKYVKRKALALANASAGLAGRLSGWCGLPQLPGSSSGLELSELRGHECFWSKATAKETDARSRL